MNVPQCYVTWTMTVLVMLSNTTSPIANNCSHTKYQHVLQYDTTALHVLQITSHKLQGQQENKTRVNRNFHIPGTFTDGFSDIPGMG